MTDVGVGRRRSVVGCLNNETNSQHLHSSKSLCRMPGDCVCLQTNNVIFYINDQYNSSFNIPEKLSWAASLHNNSCCY